MALDRHDLDAAAVATPPSDDDEKQSEKENKKLLQQKVHETLTHPAATKEDLQRSIEAKRKLGQTLAGTPPPAVPELQEPGKVPEQGFGNFKQDTQTWIALVSLLAGIAGMASRNHATTALNAFGSAIQGLKEGNKDAFDEGYKTWKASNDNLLSTNDQRIQKYNAILNNQQLGLEQKKQEMLIVASQFQDKIMYDALMRGDMQTVNSILHQSDQLQNQLTIATQKIEEQRQKLELQQRVAEDNMLKWRTETGRKQARQDAIDAMKQAELAERYAGLADRIHKGQADEFVRVFTALLASGMPANEAFATAAKNAPRLSPGTPPSPAGAPTPPAAAPGRDPLGIFNGTTR